MPQVTAHELVRFLKTQGFIEDRQVGSHLTLRHKQHLLSVTIPVHTGCDIGRGLAVRILKDAGFSVEDYLRYDNHLTPENTVGFVADSRTKSRDRFAAGFGAYPMGPAAGVASGDHTGRAVGAQ
jgi:predicted RNA binding protein YcfA (HicA-like mRNA interferase family)